MIAIAVLPCLATPLSFTSGRPSDQTSAVPTTSEDPLQASPSRQALGYSRSNKLVVFAPTDKTRRLTPSQRYVRSVRHLRIPIGPAQPNSVPSSPRFPPYEAFERRPRVEPRAPAKGRRPKPFSKAVIPFSTADATVGGKLPVVVLEVTDGGRGA